MATWIPPPVIDIEDLVPDAAALSERRRKILFEILPKVLGGSYVNGKGGNAKWNDLAKSYDPSKELALQAAMAPGAFKNPTTTCGALPGYVAGKLGVEASIAREGMMSSGLNSVRDAARKQKSWTPNSPLFQAMSGGQMPRPGDIYALCSTHHPDSLLVHIGIVVRPGKDGANWWTADSGQGKWPDQECRLVQRQYTNSDCMMTGESTTGLVRNKRMLAGWVDVDQYPFKS